MSAVACYQRNGKTGNLEMLAIDMTGKTDTMQVTDKHRQGTGTGRASCWELSRAMRLNIEHIFSISISLPDIAFIMDNLSLSFSNSHLKRMF